MAYGVLDHISHSQIELWQSCPRKWEFSKIHRIRKPRKATLIEGSVYHSTVQYNFTEKMKTGKDLPMSELADVYGALWSAEVSSSKEGVDWGDYKEEAYKKEGLELVSAYMRDMASTITPYAVERTYPSEVGSLKIDGLTFTFRVDLITEKGHVIDHKTSSKRYSQSEVDKKLQPSAAAYALCRPVVFYYHVAVKSKNGAFIQPVRTVRGQPHIDWWLRMATDVVKQMKTGICPPNSTGFLCSPGYCEYWGECMPDLASTTFVGGGE